MNESQYHHLYDWQWRKASKAFLEANPLCADHKRLGRTVAATVVDHIIKHEGDKKLFWQRENWQSLCAHCHNSHKQRCEKSGIVAGCDVSGIPLDPNHHWSDE